MFLASLIADLVGLSRRRAVAVLLAGLLLGLGAAWYGVTHLAISTDTDELFSESLPWRQRQIAWNRAFPQFDDLLVAVVDGDIPEVADATAAALDAALAKDTANFRSVRRPEASPYLARNALLFLDPKPLQDLLDRTIDAQPFLGQLAADPSARGLFAAVSLLAMGAARGEADLSHFAQPLRGFHQALSDAVAGHPRPLSWEDLLAGPLAAEAGRFRFVLTQPKLDYGALQPGADATKVIRAAAASLPFVQDGSARVRLTGSVALADEEFGTLVQGMTVGLLGSIALITLWLVLALRSWRLIVPILLTLILGLTLTLAFAALAVGTLNLISVAFAILFVGIAVDFAIQLGVRLRARLGQGDEASTMDVTARLVGPQVLVAAVATACGFLAFVPTSFAGVAELGLIAGIGMIIALVCTLLFMPAVLSVCRPRPSAGFGGLPGGAALEAWLVRHRRIVLATFAALGLAGLVLLPGITFDSDPLHTKNPNTEGMRTLAELAASPLTDPYTVDILRPTLGDADGLAVRLRKLPQVDRALTLSSLVPDDQPPKLALIADAASILGPTLAPRSPAAPVTPADLRMAARAAEAQLDQALPRLPPDDPLRAIARDLHALGEAPDAMLLAANEALTRFLPLQLDRLRAALQAAPVSVTDVPADLARDWRLPDGQARIQVVGTPQTRGNRGLHELVTAVLGVAPDAGGSAVTIVETAATIIAAFRSAAIYALFAIGVVIALTLRRVDDLVLVMTPLILGALLTAVAVRLLGMSLNFANIIALPLLLGVGVSFNVYFVMNRRAGYQSFLERPTARAVVFSALTTGSAFGTLAASDHPGTASMGELLLLSLAGTLLASLLFLPTLLRVLPPVRSRPRG